MLIRWFICYLCTLSQFIKQVLLNYFADLKCKTEQTAKVTKNKTKSNKTVVQTWVVYDESKWQSQSLSPYLCDHRPEFLVYVHTCVTVVLSSLQSPNTSYILRVLLHYEEMHKKPYFLVSHTSGYCFYGDVFCLGSIKDGFTVARIISEQQAFFSAQCFSIIGNADIKCFCVFSVAYFGS